MTKYITRFFIVAGLLLAVAGVAAVSGLTQCVDAMFEREPQLFGEPYKVQLQFGEQSFTRVMRCEKFYDAQCSVRGNYWAVREVGENSQNSRHVAKLRSDTYGVVTFPLPNCHDIVNVSQLKLKYYDPTIDGDDYLLVSSKGSLRTFKLRMSAEEWKHERERRRAANLPPAKGLVDVQRPTKTIDVTLQVNDTVVE